jgi:uncharacterized protein YjbJ (UPF0337 family)
MSATDKAKNQIENLKGKAKQGVGKVTGDTEKQAAGRGKQAKSDLKNAGEKVKDAASR